MGSHQRSMTSGSLSNSDSSTGLPSFARTSLSFEWLATNADLAVGLLLGLGQRLVEVARAAELGVGADRRRLDAVEERVGRGPLKIVLIRVPEEAIVRIADRLPVLDDIGDDVVSFCSGSQ